MKQYSTLYFLLQKWCEFGYWFHFKNRVILYDSVPKSGTPVIYCANHQNAFLDAMLIMAASNTQPATLVRADVFQSTAGKFLLESVKMMPVYRMRDGIRSVSKNEKTFEQSRRFLSNGGSLIVFPEGNHAGLKRLRPLKHGAASIAASTVLRHETPEVLLQPVGLEYSDHPKFRANVLIHFGTPVHVNKQVLYDTDQPKKAIRNLTGKIEVGLKKLIYHQDAPRHNSLIYKRNNCLYPVHVLSKGLFLRNFQNARKDAELFNHKPLSSLQVTDMETAINKAVSLGFPGIDHNQKRDFIIPLMVCFSTFIFVPAGLLVFGLPYFTIKLTQYQISDRQFRSGIKFAAGMLLIPVWLLIITVFTFLYLPFLYAVSFLAGAVISGTMSIMFRDHFRECKRVWKWFTKLSGSDREKYTQEIVHGLNLEQADS